MKLTQRIVDEVKMMSIRDQVSFLYDFIDDCPDVREEKEYLNQFNDLLKEIKHFCMMPSNIDRREFIILNIVQLYRDKKINDILDEL